MHILRRDLGDDGILAGQLGLQLLDLGGQLLLPLGGAVARRAFQGNTEVLEEATLLRRAKVLASALGNNELASWASHELQGYPDDAPVPEYRRVPSQPVGDFSGPFGSSATHMTLPISAMPASMQKNAKSVEARQPIKELATLAKVQQDELRVPWPPEAVIILRDKIKLTGGFQLIEMYQPVSPAQLEGVVDAVRNRLLDLVLALEKLHPDAADSDTDLGSLPSEAVARAVNITIFGSQNVVTTGQMGAQSVTIGIPAGDLPALLSQLRTIGLEEDDIVELQAAIEVDGQQSPGSFGSRVKSWLSKALTKTAQGTWDITKAAAPTVITKALAQYYGWGN